jgi:hypothetical protein
MFKPDLIITWPRNTDYPLWREFIRNNRTRFNNVIIVFMNPNTGTDYREFIRKVMFKDFVLFVDSPEPKTGEDWRNIAVHAGLFHSLHSEWLWFTEQDFLPIETDDERDFWSEVEHGVNEGNSVIGVKDQTRLHPCSLFIKREALNITCKDFGIVPNKLDHFGLIQRDIEITKLPTFIVNERYYYHMNGLSHNFRLVAEGLEPNYEVRKFRKYMEDCLKVKVPLDDRFKNLASYYLANNIEKLD